MRDAMPNAMPDAMPDAKIASRRGVRGTQLAVTLLAGLLIVACSVQLGNGPGAGVGCASANCPPPARSGTRQEHACSAQGFSFVYFDPWTADSCTSSSNNVTVSAQTNYGDLTVQFASTSVAPGTSAQALLSKTVNNLDTSQLSGMQDAGPIYGAAIGYISGAGNTYTATYDQPNAPSVPVFLEIMASVHGTRGIVFLSASTLDPNGPDPTDPLQVPNGDYDQMVNSITWQ
jgi:hypothetical protein